VTVDKNYSLIHEEFRDLALKIEGKLLDDERKYVNKQLDK